MEQKKQSNSGTRGHNYFPKNSEFCTWMIATILGIGVLWQILEYMIYGEIQPRIVDDIIGLTYIIAILHAYKMGRSHEKEAQINYRHIENFWSNSPVFYDNDSINNQKYND